MGRKIQTTEEAAETAADDAPPGVTFIKNQVNELITFEDGSTYQFLQAKVTITDHELIEKLRSVKDRCHIFEV